MNPLRKIGLYGGTFDPIHHGHLILAREALEMLGLDRVVFIPAGVSPHKLARPPAPARARCEMLAASIAGEESFAWDDCEIRRSGPSYAIDTVRGIQARHPEAALFFFIGEDNLAALDTWKEITALRQAVQFVVFSRSAVPPNHPFPSILRRVDISSTDIRNRIATGRSVRYLLPEAACAILSTHLLYRNE